MQELAIVYAVAGMSSRFGGESKALAKLSDGRHWIEHSLDDAIPAGINKIIFIVGKHTENEFKKIFGNNYRDIQIQYALQKYDSETRDKPWGTADALCSAIEHLDCPFIFCNGDDRYGEQTIKTLADHLKKSQEDATIGYKLKDVLEEEKKANRAIFTIKDNHVINIKEKLGISKTNLGEGIELETLCSVGIFALHPQTIKHLAEKVEQFKIENQRNRNIECLLPNELSNLIQEKKMKMKIYPATEKWEGITYKEDLEKYQ